MEYTIDCKCEFTKDPEDEDDYQYHYLRTCYGCFKNYWSLHCEHDGHQNRCSFCGARNQTLHDINEQKILSLKKETI